MRRRDFLAGAGGAFVGSATVAVGADGLSGSPAPSDEHRSPAAAAQAAASFAGGRRFNDTYRNEYLNQIAFPLGGMGAGMICLEGTGALTKFSLRNRPDLSSEPTVFAAISLKDAQGTARVLEAPVPRWKLRPFFPAVDPERIQGISWGLPRFHQAVFATRFPFATIQLHDPAVPLEVELTGWSPFSPGDADNASLPVAALEYRFSNRSDAPVEGVFSFHAENFLAEPKDPLDLKPNPNSLDRIQPTQGGFILYGSGGADHPWDAAHCAIWTDAPDVKVNHVWFRGFPLDSMQMVWKDIATRACYERASLPDSCSPGASLFVPFSLMPAQTTTITLRLAWYAPKSDVAENMEGAKDDKSVSGSHAPETYQPWYAGRFAGIQEVQDYWQSHCQSLRQKSHTFAEAFYDSTLPPEITEAIAANLTILKSPTVLRQTDGRLWCWEGIYDSSGGDPGSCTHVWNYAQAIAHLFPDLERGLRETEFGENQNEEGHQVIRAALPIRPLKPEIHAFPAAPDGQLGGVIKAYRDWRISGDTAWLRRWWPRIRASLDYCIRTWDPECRGQIEEPHANTFDVTLWGADSMCTSIYLGALKAAVTMGASFGENVDRYARLLNQGVRQTEQRLFNGEYFFQRTTWRGLHKSFPMQENDNLALFYRPGYTEQSQLAKAEGPPHQYGDGCLSDGVLGEWLSFVSGLDDVLDRQKIASHLSAVHRHNLKYDLTDHVNGWRFPLAGDAEAGLTVCTWPRGGKPSLPLFYAGETWTGTEYQVASHLIALGKIEEGLEIVRACRRRYDGRTRNPFDELESGHWYARAMSCYALLQACSGARFDAVDKTLHLKPAIKGDFRCFLSTATGFGTVGVKDGHPFVEVVSGRIPYDRIEHLTA